NEHVADDRAAAGSLEMMFVAKTRKGPVCQFFSELIRRIEHAPKELQHDRKDAVDGLHESGDARLHRMCEQPEARHPLVQHALIGGILMEAKEIFQIRVNAA